jgi:hypothetical protein
MSALVFGVSKPYLLETIMEYQTPQVASRMHPLMIGAAASVVLVSLLGAAAITGILPSSHSTPAPTAFQSSSASMASGATQTVTPVSASRFITADGRVLEEVPTTAQATSVRADLPTKTSSVASDVPVHRKLAHHAVHHQQQVALNDSVPQYEQPVYQAPQAQPQPIYQPQPQPASVFGNVNPVQTGVGAVIGGLLGSQVGKGNGRTLATVAGVIAGGYAGNEISHGRSPVPTW